MSHFSSGPDSSPLSQSSSSRRLSQGQRFERYEVLGLLGEGGMGTVYKVRQDGNIFALKLMKADQTDPRALGRFHREAELAAAIRHPNVVTIHRAGLAHGCAFLVFEFIEGESLDKLIELDKPWDTRDALTLLRSVARALGALHEQGIVHRDLKPANIFIRQRDKAPLLGDFGLAKSKSLSKLTKTGEFLGTPSYMSPEQVEGEELGQGTDVWAFGVLAYELLTGGHKPFEAESVASLGARILTRDPSSLRKFVPVPISLERALEKAFEKDPHRRPPSALALVEALQESLLAESGSKISQSLRKVRASPRLLVALLLLVVASIYPILYLRGQSIKTDTSDQYKALAYQFGGDVQVMTAAHSLFLTKNSDGPQSIVNDWQALELEFASAPVKGIAHERGRLAVRFLLEGYKGPIPRVKSPYNRICMGLRNFSKGQWVRSNEQFLQGLSRAEEPMKSLIQLCLVFVNIELKNWEGVLERIARVKSKSAKKLFESDFQALTRLAQKEKLLNGIFNSNVDQFVDMCRDSQLLDRPKFLRDFQTQCEAEMGARLGFKRLSPKAYRNQLKQFHSRQLRIRRRLPEFKGIFNDDLLRFLITEHDGLKEDAEAFYYRTLLHLRSHPNEILDTQGAKRDYGTVGRSIDVQLIVLVSRRENAEVFSWLSVAYALGIPLESIQPETLTILRKSGIFREMRKERPWDKSSYYWSGMGVDYELDSKKLSRHYQDRIKELLTALKDDQMSPLYRAVANAMLANYYYYSCKSDGDIPKARQLCLELIDKAKKHHPEPDKLLGFKSTFLSWGKSPNLQTLRKLLVILKESQRLLCDRYKRTKEGRLAEGRPLKSPYHSVDRAFKERLSGVIFGQGKIYEDLGERKRALAAYKESGTKYPNPFLYECWFRALGLGLPKEAYRDIRASLDRWRTDRRTQGVMEKQLNEIYIKIPK